MCLRVPSQVNRKAKVKTTESSDESEGETVQETQQVTFSVSIYLLNKYEYLYIVITT